MSSQVVPSWSQAPQNDPDMISWGPNMLPQGDHASLQDITQAPHQGPMGESIPLQLQLGCLSHTPYIYTPLPPPLKHVNLAGT